MLGFITYEVNTLDIHHYLAKQAELISKHLYNVAEEASIKPSDIYINVYISEIPSLYKSITATAIVICTQLFGEYRKFTRVLDAEYTEQLEQFINEVSSYIDPYLSLS